MEAFHIFVAIYAEKHPEAICHLMTYISTIQQIAEACGDSAAFTYDEKFRRWRHRDPAACPWEQKRVELYQEAVLAGMDFKLKNKNQPFRGQLKFIKYCYAFNNSGSCSRGRSCTFAHVCQYCHGKHSKQNCMRPRQNPTTKQHNLPPPLKLLSPCRNKVPSTHHVISTPIQVQPLKNYLTAYNAETKLFLLRGFTFGFRIPYTGDRCSRFSNNLSSLHGREVVIRERLQQELLADRIAGPFKDPPFPNIQVSPLGLVPKQEPEEFRLIHHLSFPEGGSINDHIPPQFSFVQYQSIEDAIALIQQVGPGALLANTDIENAYKQIPIHPDDFELLGFQFENRYYYDKPYLLASATPAIYLRSSAPPSIGF
jgi:hypothetical protein